MPKQLNTEHLASSVATLSSALDYLKTVPTNTIEHKVFRNAAIKGFELCLEISGKLLR